MEDTEPNQPSKVIRQGIKWRDWDTKPATKTFDLVCPACSVLGSEPSRIIRDQRNFIHN